MFKKTLLSAIVALPCSFFIITSSHAGSVEYQNCAGTVSVSDAATLDELTYRLQKESEKAGAKSFKIISATGKDRLSGRAIIYK